MFTGENVGPKKTMASPRRDRVRTARDTGWNEAVSAACAWRDVTAGPLAIRKPQNNLLSDPLLRIKLAASTGVARATVYRWVIFQPAIGHAERLGSDIISPPE